jgi:hypothetical protein
VGLLNFAFPVRKECAQALAVFFVSIFGSAPVRQSALARLLLTFWSRGEEINSRAPNVFCLDLFFLRSDFSTPGTAALVGGSLRPLAKTRSPLSSSWFCCPPPRRFSFGSLFSVRVGAPCQVRLLFWPPPARSGLPLPICFTATDFPCLAVWVSMFGPRVQELAL